jgi:hypothetical protein
MQITSKEININVFEIIRRNNHSDDQSHPIIK